MDIQEDLYQLITKANIEDALYVTGVMIINDKIQQLEHIWIRACCGTELKDMLPSAWKWRHIIEDTYRIVKSESFDITDAFLLTAKLCIFYKEVLVVENGENTINGKKPSVHIKQLRTIIMDDFPEDSVLSNAGIKKYAPILPTNEQELVFAHRILSGLSKIWTERLYHKSRNALEYLSRRKLKLDLPDKSWPSPSPDTASEFIWFLWGAILCYFHNSDIVEKMYILFNFHNKRHRQHRYGLLWHIYYVAGNIEGSIWTIDENKWLTYIKDNASKIWQEIQDSQKELKDIEKALKKASGDRTPAEEFDEIFDYVPRTGDRHVLPEDSPYQPSHMYDVIENENDMCTEKKIKIVGLKASRDIQSFQASVRKIE